MPQNTHLVTLPSASDRLMIEGPIIAVRVGYDGASKPGMRVMPNIPHDIRTAMVDTGSQITCISASLARTLALPIIGETTIWHPGGSKSMRMCRAHIVFVDHRVVQDCDCVIADDLTSRPGCAIDVLIGRSNLKQFAFHYDGASGVASLRPAHPMISATR